MSFVPATRGIYHGVTAMALSKTGKIYAGGYQALSRYNTDGSYDESFPSVFFNLSSASILNLTIQNDGKVLVGGTFDRLNGTNKSYIARINDDGALDWTFNPILDDFVSATAMQPDGKILLAGNFTSVNGVPQSRICRLLGDQPVLTIRSAGNGNAVVSWPAAYTNHVLQTVSSVASTNWITVTNSPAIVSNLCVVTNPITSGNQFFRLAQP